MIEILYVDDEEALLEIGKIYLERSEGIHVDTALSVSSALELIGQKRYDAIVSDYQMPSRNGIEFLRSLRSSGNNVPFILFTGKGREEVVIEALNSGANFYLQKGGNPEAQYHELEHHIKIAVQQRAGEESLRKKNEELREKEHLFRLITENMTDVVTILDLSLNFTYVSPSMKELRGFTAEEVMGQSLSELVTPRSLEDLAAVFADEYEQWKIGKGDPHHVRYIELEEYTKDGSTIWVGNNISIIPDENGIPKAIIAIAYDITERRSVERTLRESEARFDSLAEHSRTFTWDTDENGLFTFVSRISEATLGYRPEDLVGKMHFFDLIPPKGRESIKSPAIEMIKRRESITALESPALTKDGRQVWVSINGFPVLNPDGTLKGYQGEATDITERKIAENELRTANRKLNLLSRITRHDISNQALIINSSLELLKMRQNQLANDDLVHKMSRALDQISAIIHFTWVYEDIGIHTPVWHDVHTAIAKASSQASSGNVRVINDVPSGLQIYADPLIHNVFFNLIDNAVRYGGSISNIRFTMERTADAWMLVCEDDGGGVPTEMKARLFEQGVGKGHGLGLFLSREILSITGIVLSEDGEPGKGAHFIMRVPADGVKVQ